MKPKPKPKSAILTSREVLFKNAPKAAKDLLATSVSAQRQKRRQAYKESQSQAFNA
jgi:ribosomal protein L4